MLSKIAVVRGSAARIGDIWSAVPWGAAGRMWSRKLARAL